MARRFDVGPLFGGVASGLRHRRASGPEPADRLTRAVLVGIPVVVAVSTALGGVVLPVPEQLLAGVSLLVGALFAGFTQVAAWRDRLEDRRVATDRVRIRALREAGAHILASVVAGGAAAVITIALACLPETHGNRLIQILEQAFSSFAFGVLSYLSLTILIVVNLLWDAFDSPSGSAE
jgi:hypothetical protein